MKITEALKKRRLISDGGFGTMLQAAGMTLGEASEMWNLSHKDIIIDVHKQYIAAGCDIITANTFGVNTLKYDKDTVKAMIEAAVECARSAVGERDIYVSLDVGPLGRLLKPYGDLDFEEAVGIFAYTVKCGVECGVDLVMIETMNDIYETKAALLAAKENSDLPVFVTNVFDSTGKQMTGADVRATVALLEGMGADAIGMNCSLGPVQMLGLVKEFLRYSSTPIIVQPNAGLPVERDGKTTFDIDSDIFAACMAQMAEMGVAILGGCCGTTPEYIRKTLDATREIPYSYISQKNHTLVSSYTHAHEINNTPTLIGERINPTGKKKLKVALRENNMSYILSEALGQAERGAHILDVNVGLPEIDEVSMLSSAVSEIQAVSDLPLQLDSVNYEAMASAMRIYNGKPLVNSVNGSRESMDKIFPLVKKYGGAVIALTMDESGIPETAVGRVEIVKRIVEVAAEYGIDKKDIIVDPLALTVSSNPESAKVTLEAIERITEMGLKTSLGISNISFGLPERDNLTAAFFTMALTAGLNCAIMNPYSYEVMKAYHSYLALSGMDANFEKYIDFVENTQKAEATQSVKTVEAKPCGESVLQNAIIKGLKVDAAREAGELLKIASPMDIINSHIIPALNIVGEGYENKKIYLPGLLMSADASQEAFSVIKDAMPRSVNDGKAPIVLATVKGDIHDIGKNIVKILLENFGFSVIDLGRDVSPRVIVDTVKESGARLLCLSALMTTTVKSMEETISLMKEEGIECPVMVGGAVLNEEYADMIGADAYGPDAMAAVRYAQSVVK